MADSRTHKTRAKKGSRFDAVIIGRRLELARTAAGLSQQDIATEIWPTQSPESARQLWSKLVAGTLRDFKLAELEVAVDRLARKLGDHPEHPELRGTKLPGFPFIDLRESRSLERGSGP